MPREKLGMRWANFALQGWSGCRRVDRVLEHVVPRGLFYNAEITGLKPAPMSRPIVLFDLDGTLSDSAPGILAALRHAFAVQRHRRRSTPHDRARAARAAVLRVAAADRRRRTCVRRVIDAYREHYATAMYDTDGVPRRAPRCSTALRADGRRLAVATSKPEHYAVPIVEHLGLADVLRDRSAATSSTARCRPRRW